jgi:hypothetical protein
MVHKALAGGGADQLQNIVGKFNGSDAAAIGLKLARSLREGGSQILISSGKAEKVFDATVA